VRANKQTKSNLEIDRHSWIISGPFGIRAGLARYDILFTIPGIQLGAAMTITMYIKADMQLMGRKVQKNIYVKKKNGKKKKAKAQAEAN